MALPEAYEVTHALDLVRRQGHVPPAELRFLTYVVDRALAGQENEVSQKTVAADIFGRDLLSFDPRSDSIVRTTAANLRETLLHYYAGPGRADPVVIELPKGTYVPRFSRRARLSSAATSRLWSARVALESRTVSGYATAISHLDAVLSEAPDFSLALALKAESLASQAIHGSRPRPCLEQARVLAGRALEAPLPAWQAWLARALVLQALDLNWTAAGEAYQKAIEASSGEAETHVWYTAYLVGRGRPREAVLILQRTVDHFGYCNPTLLGDLAMLQMLARDYDAARETIDAALAAAPQYYQHHLNRAILMEALNDPAEALRVLDQTPLRLHERPVTWGLRGLFAGLSGHPKIALRRISWFRGIQRTGRYIPPSQLAACWLGAGKPDLAVHHLESSVEDRDPLAVWFHAYPFFRHLHSHPGFQNLIDRIGLIRGAGF
ncbi:MAG TPA: tetratricopeptide repeat protein [Verrucomicrobiae bacterium]|nr:tetratricopeptide repeat protein [Verrucomicrobiae bacterium]